MTDRESAAFGKVSRMVSVSATGSVAVEPNVVWLSLGVVTEAQAAQEALARNNVVMAALVNGLKSVGIASKDLQTLALRVTPRHRYTEEPEDERPETIIGYLATNHVEVTVRDVTRAGEILDLAVSLGANQIGHISFGVSDAESLMDKARVRAVETARQRGELYAKAAGAQLGQVLSISESSYDKGAYPYAIASYGGAAFAQHRSPPPIETGAREVSVQVHIVYGLY